MRNIVLVSTAQWVWTSPKEVHFTEGAQNLLMKLSSDTWTWDVQGPEVTADLGQLHTHLPS